VNGEATSDVSAGLQGSRNLLEGKSAAANVVVGSGIAWNIQA